MPNNVPLSGSSTVYLFTDLLKTSWLLPSFSKYEKVAINICVHSTNFKITRMHHVTVTVVDLFKRTLNLFKNDKKKFSLMFETS